MKCEQVLTYERQRELEESKPVLRGSQVVYLYSANRANGTSDIATCIDSVSRTNICNFKTSIKYVLGFLH